MPELPEVETIVRKLRPHLKGRIFTEVELLWEGVADRPDPATFCEQVVGAKVVALGRRGKYLIFTLESGAHLLVHLRMTGKFRVHPAGEEPEDDTHARALFRMDDGTRLIYVDTRKFGRFYLVDDPAEVVGALGPEPLSEDFTAEDFAQRLAGRRGEIKRLLLNQHFIAGLGNIYVSEALWQAGIHPERTADTLTEEEIRRLHRAITEALRAGIRNGGTSLQDRQYVYPDGALGRHQERLVVYDREGERCPRCGYAVVRIVQGQRSTYFCRVCQPSPSVEQESS
jgi:formamidopyrimidine-DNA glycosylase